MRMLIDKATSELIGDPADGERALLRRFGDYRVAVSDLCPTELMSGVFLA